LEDDLEPPPANGSPKQLITITVRFVPPYLKVREEALHCFVKHNVVSSQFVSFKVVLKVCGYEAMPVDHYLFCPFCTFLLAGTFSTCRQPKEK